MHDKTLFILAAVLCLIVTAILAVGIGGFAKGGEFNRKNGNRMMRWRLIAQFATIVIILGYLWIRSR